jgi:transcription elongation factor GreB
MSKAFTKEDTEIPERAGRLRSGSGLPPGATNYMTAEGARRLREQIARLQKPPTSDAARQIPALQHILSSATIVPAVDGTPKAVRFGTTVSVRDSSGKLATYRIVGVDETQLEEGWISWLTPLAKALIGARVGQRVPLSDAIAAESVEIVSIGS